MGGDQAHGRGVRIESLKGQFQPKPCCDSVILGLTGTVTASHLQLYNVLQGDSLKDTDTDLPLLNLRRTPVCSPVKYVKVTKSQQFEETVRVYIFIYIYICVCVCVCVYLLPCIYIIMVCIYTHMCRNIYIK